MKIVNQETIKIEATGKYYCQIKIEESGKERTLMGTGKTASAAQADARSNK